MLGTWGRWGHTGKQAVQQALWEPSASRRNHLWDIQAWLGHLWKTGQGDDSWDTHGTGRMVRLVGTSHHGHGDDDGKRAAGNLQKDTHFWEQRSTSGAPLGWSSFSKDRSRLLGFLVVSLGFSIAHGPALSPCRSGHGQGGKAEPGQVGPKEAIQQQPVPVSASAWATCASVGPREQLLGGPV